MTVPLDRLYHFVENIAQEIYGNLVVIYRFYPHGSKKIQDLTLSKEQSVKTYLVSPEIICNDQEPLNYDLYHNFDIRLQESPNSILNTIYSQHSSKFPTFNLRGPITNIWDHALLLHSEDRSAQVELYKNTQFIPVYYWSHAVIAKDWFRYAEHVAQKKNVNQTFLIYNRAWSGTREYRLRFAELLIQTNLQKHCQTTVNPIEPELGIHYNTHQFCNPIWRPQTVLENYFPASLAHSGYSADFDIEDYQSTDVEVVLETLFDDSRLHLTEKSLRPIACGQPFIIVGTSGSLEYLRRYGFKTFADIWDESYDLVENPQERLIQIAELMKLIANWPADVRENKMAQARVVADYNHQHFFSKEFFDLVVDELKTNLVTAFEQIEEKNTSSFFMQRQKILNSIPEWVNRSDRNTTPEEDQQVLAQALKYYQRIKS